MSTKTKTKPIARIPFVQTFQTQDLARTTKQFICATCDRQKQDLVVVNGCQTTTFVTPRLVCKECLFGQVRDEDEQKEKS